MIGIVVECTDQCVPQDQREALRRSPSAQSQGPEHHMWRLSRLGAVVWVGLCGVRPDTAPLVRQKYVQALIYV